jgi:hypothetical protein
MDEGFIRTNYKGRVKYVCSKCGGDNVGVDAATYWCKDKQEFVVGAIYDTPDHVWCSNDGCEAKGISVIPIKL